MYQFLIKQAPARRKTNYIVMDFKKFINGALGRPEKGDKVEYFNLRNRVSGYILTKAQRCGCAYGGANGHRLCG